MRTPQIVLSVGLLVLVVLLLSPQRHRPAYNTANEVTLTGVVGDITDFYCPVSGTVGTHFMLATEHGNVQVHVAPSRFVGDQKWQWAPGDKIEVVGSRLNYLGHEALIARTIVRGNEIMALRSSDGKPLWVE